jgi:ParB family chromosome partitioning protein
MTTIRAIVDDADDERSAELALIENMQREDLNPIERALGLRQLMDRFGSTQQELSDRIGMSRPGLANLLRLLDLGDDLQALVATGVLSVGHAKVLLSCHDETQRSKLAHDAIEQGWTVRALEQAIASAGSVVPASPETAGAGEQGAHAVLHPDRVGSVLRDLERSLSEHLGTRVTLKTNKQGTKGRVQIEFFDLDQFDGLLAKLGVHGERV